MGKELDWVREEKSGRLIYRRRYPEDLRPHLAKPGQRELKVPLGARWVMTADSFQKYDAAKRQFEQNVRDAQALRLLREKEQAAAFDALTPDRVKHFANLAVHDQRTGMEQRLQEGQGRIAREAWTWLLPELQRARADGDKSLLEGILGQTADRLMASEGFRADPTDLEGRSRLLWAMNAAIVAEGDAIQNHLAGLAPAMPRKPRWSHNVPADIRTVSMLMSAYKAAKWDGWGLSSRSAVEPVVRLLKDAIGDRDVRSIDREAARGVFDLVRALPVHLGRHAALKKLSVPAAIEKGKQLGLATISPKTINAVYMAHISAMFKWAAKEDWVLKNPFEALNVVDPVAPEDKRDPFKLDQLSILFSAAPWATRQADNASKPGLYWLPLIALYSGMRLGEIGGLRTRDVESVEGVACFLVRPHAARRLKNKESRRVLPIHSALEELGLLSYVAHRTALSSADAPLFPDAKANVRGQSAAKLSEAFAEIVKERGLTGTKLGFHSFRHSFEDRLRAAGLHGRAEGQALGGRKVSGSEGAYGHGFTAIELRRALERVSYPGLDLTHLLP